MLSLDTGTGATGEVSLGLAHGGSSKEQSVGAYYNSLLDIE